MNELNLKLNASFNITREAIQEEVQKGTVRKIALVHMPR